MSGEVMCNADEYPLLRRCVCWRGMCAFMSATDQCGREVSNARHRTKQRIQFLPQGVEHHVFTFNQLHHLSISAISSNSTNKPTIHRDNLTRHKPIPRQHQHQLRILLLPPHPPRRILMPLHILLPRLPRLTPPRTRHLTTEQPGSNRVDPHTQVGAEAEFVREHLGEVVGSGLARVVGVMRLGELNDAGDGGDVDDGGCPGGGVGGVEEG